jgi:hypothetical protein
MKTTLKTIVMATIVASTVLTSCSVQKRMYSNGYNINWNSKINKAKPQQLATIESELPTTQTQDEVIASASTNVLNNNSEMIIAPPKITPPLITRHITKRNNAIAKQDSSDYIRTQPNNTNNSAKATEQIVTHPAAISGLTFTIIGAILTILGAILIVTADLVALIFGALFLFAAAASLVTGGIFGIIALIAIKKNKQKYKGNTIALIATVPLALIALLMLISLIVM